MGWWVDGRRRLTSSPEHRAVMRNYVGNVTTFTVAETSVEEIKQKTLAEVASMVRDAIAAPAPYEEHKGDKKRYVEMVSIGLGSPTVNVTAFSSFAVDTDFGFGHAAMAMPTSASAARLCSGFVQIVARPRGDGAFLWPQLAAALESDERCCVFKPVTAEYLGLRATSAGSAKRAGIITSKI
uniref:Uncharacterized protein n=1 Tax=Leersia perrieri TaxID=77586 RepID=A0A0D9WDC2_9ORYZ